MAAHRQSIRVSTGESGLRILPRQFKDRVNQLTEETIDSLQRIWKEAGYEDVECQRLLGDLLNKLKITCANELAAEQQILEHAKQEVAANVAELTKMNDQLGRKTTVEYISKMNYTEKLAELEKLLQSVGEAYSERQSMLDKEMSSIKKLCDELGESVPQENIFAGPAGMPYLSDLRLNLMREFVRDLEVMKQKRIEEMKSIAKEAVVHMSDMMYVEEGYKTMGDSENYVSLDKNTVLLHSTGDLSATSLTAHKHNLAAMTLRLKLFLEEKERRRQHLAASGDEIAKLWSLLRVPSVEREAFQASFQRNLSMDTLAKGDAEVRRLQDIRRRSLGRVIQCIRSDIQTLWEEAGMESEEQRSREFPMFFRDIDALEDAAVDVHEAYFVQLRGRVEELKPILSKVSKREQVVAERIELEHLQLNPERLTARGPNAREERKREEAMTNRVKGLEKITKEIVIQIQAWEEKNGPFIYGGERYLDRIPRQEEAYIENRDLLRNARKKKDGKDASSTGTFKTTLGAKRPGTAGTGTGGSAGLGSSGGLHTPHPKSRPHMEPSSSMKVPSVITIVHDCENLPPPPNRDSEGTIDTYCTSVTETKDRGSNGSCTVVREVVEI